jgi:hypothetical protein
MIPGQQGNCENGAIYHEGFSTSNYDFIKSLAESRQRKLLLLCIGGAFC